MTPGPIRFVTVPEVLRLHAILIEDQGGDPSLRDPGLLESAVAQPQQTMFGEYLHPDIVSMAAAYAFHICGNHAFVDGNKRAATAAMIKFLNDNGWSFNATADEAEPVILRLASGMMEKAELTAWLRSHAREKTTMELRDFFRALTHDEIAALTRAFHTAGNHEERLASIREAQAAMPVITECMEKMLSEQVRTSESAHHYAAILSTLMAIYRIAEDKGYEW
jgi:death-on-curing protein